jgi:hypothetical protein
LRTRKVNKQMGQEFQFKLTTAPIANHASDADTVVAAAVAAGASVAAVCTKTTRSPHCEHRSAEIRDTTLASRTCQANRGSTSPDPSSNHIYLRRRRVARTRCLSGTWQTSLRRRYRIRQFAQTLAKKK